MIAALVAGAKPQHLTEIAVERNECPTLSNRDSEHLLIGCALGSSWSRTVITSWPCVRNISATLRLRFSSSLKLMRPSQGQTAPEPPLHRRRSPPIYLHGRVEDIRPIGQLRSYRRRGNRGSATPRSASP